MMKAELMKAAGTAVTSLRCVELMADQGDDIRLMIEDNIGLLARNYGKIIIPSNEGIYFISEVKVTMASEYNITRDLSVRAFLTRRM